MNTEQERYEFEAWAVPHFMKQVSELYRQGKSDSWPGQYDDYAIQCAWEAWKARAAECRVPDNIRERLFSGWRGCSNHGCVVTGPNRCIGTNATCQCIVNASRVQLQILQARMHVLLQTDPQSEHASATEADLDRLIKERDYWEEKATELAEAVGAHFGFDAGEHSSANCPVQTAIDQLEEIQSAPDPEQCHISLTTDDDVERVAKAAGWDNRKFMSQPDYEFWCERMREFVRLCGLQPEREETNEH